MENTLVDRGCYLPLSMNAMEKKSKVSSTGILATEEIKMYVPVEVQISGLDLRAFVEN
jgi:hypothetical protein